MHHNTVMMKQGKKRPNQNVSYPKSRFSRAIDIFFLTRSIVHPNMKFYGHRLKFWYTINGLTHLSVIYSKNGQVNTDKWAEGWSRRWSAQKNKIKIKNISTHVYTDTHTHI